MLTMGKRGEGWFLIQLVLFVLILRVPSVPRIHLFETLRWAGMLLLLGGGFLGTFGLICLGRNLTPFPRPRENASLVQDCAYRYVRHPIYTGLILATLGLAVWRESVPGLAMTLLLFLFFDMKSRREERWLLDKFPDYAAYRKRVKKLIPWVY